MGRPAPLQVIERMQAMMLVRVRVRAEMMWRAASESTPPPDQAMRQALGELESTIRQLPQVARQRRQGRVLTRAELELLSAAPGGLTVQQCIDTSWADEGIGCLGWSLGLLDAMPPWDTETDVEALCDQHAATEPKTLARQARPQLRTLIDRRRDDAELWLWRARTSYILQHPEQFKTQAPMPMGFEEIIEKAAGFMAQQGRLEPIDGDFPAFGKPYRDLTRDELGRATSIATERLRAFNWLCGRHRDWDKVPTDT